jgi:hypothetical protein
MARNSVICLCNSNSLHYNHRGCDHLGRRRKRHGGRGWNVRPAADLIPVRLPGGAERILLVDDEPSIAMPGWVCLEHLE